MPHSNEELHTDEEIVVVSATATTDLTGDEICDFCQVRLEHLENRTVGATNYRIMICSANPDHIKMLQV